MLLKRQCWDRGEDAIEDAIEDDAREAKGECRLPL
jgi:hypothetical protein